MSDEDLTAAEAAARLGIKRETLYAYVSRGVLQRRMALDGRTSLFDASEVDALRRRNRRPARGELSTVIASGLTRLDESGHTYRGTAVIGLVDDDVDFETVADLLWDDDGTWSDADEETVSVIAAVQGALSESTPMLDRLRATLAALSGLDPFRSDVRPSGMAIAGRSAITGMVGGLPRLRRGSERGRLADRLWPRLTRRTGNESQRRCLNAALVLLADHGLAASTFAVRIAASVRADAYSILATGLGAVGGRLHGAASGDVHRLLTAAGQLRSAEVALGRVLERGERIPGCGHTIYRDVDPRDRVLSAIVADAWAGDDRVDLAREVAEVATARGGRPTNIDMALGIMTWLAGAEPEAGEAIFGIARSAGWLAHAIEELGERPVRLRPEARYIAG